MSRIVVFGGYGTFGRQVCRELARRGHAVTVAGRDLRRAEELMRALEGAGHRAALADARDPASSNAAVEGAAVAVLCAGPFGDMPTAVAEAALAGGVHYVDIADDRGYIRRLRALHERFAGARLCAAFGCSSLPGLSAALAMELRERRPQNPAAVRVCLFIGNRNPKGKAAITSLVGQLRGFREGEIVVLPPPYGRRRAYNFDGPEHDLFPSLVGAARVSVKVAFELRAATAVLALLARLRLRYGSATTAVLSALGRLGSGLGSSGGAVQAELEWPDGSRAAAAVVAEQDGQRMAALPAAVVADALAGGRTSAVGALLPSQVIHAGTLPAEVSDAGFRVVR